MKLNLNEEIQGGEEQVLFDKFKWEMITILAVVLLGIILANI